MNKQLDGQTRRTVIEDIKPGTVLRLPNSDGSLPPFSDVVVVGPVRTAGERIQARYGCAAPADLRAGRFVQLARPFLYVTEGGLTDVRQEAFEATTDSILQNFVTVVMSRGQPACYAA